MANNKFYLFIFCLLFGCNNAERKFPNTFDKAVLDSANHYTDSTKITNTYQDLLKTIDRSHKVIEVQAVHIFSDPKKKDTFKLELRGPDLLGSVAIFTITSHSGKEIYKEEFLGGDLIGDDDNTNPGHRDSTIINHVQRFFSDDAFENPALSDFLKDTSLLFKGIDDIDSSVYNDLKQRSFSIAFVYSYGYEGTYYLAYMPKKNEAEVFFSHD